MHRLCFILIVLVGAAGLRADVSLPGIFGEHMVLQQDVKIPVWGWADVGEAVTVEVGGQRATGVAGADGSWRVDLPATGGSGEAITLTVRGKNTITINDVLVGEVWLASGQSNMSFAVDWEPNGKELIAAADWPTMRVYEEENRPGIRPKGKTGGHWFVVTPKTAGKVSAVAYFFGRQLQEGLKRPVGLIQPSWGGTPIETWMSAEALKFFPEKAGALEEIAKEEAAFPKDPAGQEKAMNEWRGRLREWETTYMVPFEAAIKKWKVDVEAAKAAHEKLPREPERPTGRPTGRPRSPDGQEGDCTTLFNGMIHPLIPYAIKGVIWYQGEANTGPDNAAYAAMLRELIVDWRGRWKQGDFPFLVVGLANIDARLKAPSDSGWAEVRGAQAEVAATVANVGLAEAIDLGTAHNIHPPDKIDIGKRLGALATHLAYGKDVVCAGPRFEKMAVEGNKVRVTYSSVGSGIRLGVSPYVCDDAPNDNPAVAIEEPLGFEVAGEDRKWAVARGKIEGNGVVVWSEKVERPVSVRYAWSQNPPVNLYNVEGFPAVPFRTEAWRVEVK